MKKYLSIVIIILGLLTGCSKDTETKNINKITPLTNSNSAEAAELVKNNIVKIINKTSNGEIIGTGFFHQSGYLVTNSHIVDIKGVINITYPNGDVKEASLISNDIQSDVAILHVNKPEVKAMSFAETLDLRVTNPMYAIGYAYNLEGSATVTTGTLSAKRSAAGIEYLQSDAQVNPGCSGGPVINANGELLGMSSLASSNASIGMSISSESLSNIIEKLIKNKKVTYMTSKRPENALSSVLNEIGYEFNEIYESDSLIDDEQKENIQETDSNTNTTNIQTENDDKPLKSLTINKIALTEDQIYGQYHPTLPAGTTSVDVQAIPTNPKNSVEIYGNSSLKEGQNYINLIVKDGTGKIIFNRNYTIIVEYTPIIITSYPVPISKIIGGGHVAYDNSIKASVLSFNFGTISKDGAPVSINDFIDQSKLSYTFIDLYESITLKVYTDSRAREEAYRLVYTKTISGEELKIKASDNPKYPYILLSDIRSTFIPEDLDPINQQYILRSVIEVTFNDNKGTFSSLDYAYLDPQ
ncbi:MAG: S1C family serine protease [Ignavibacteriales bacterium]